MSLVTPFILEVFNFGQSECLIYYSLAGVATRPLLFPGSGLVHETSYLDAVCVVIEPKFHIWS